MMSVNAMYSMNKYSINSLSLIMFYIFDVIILYRYEINYKATITIDVTVNYYPVPDSP